MGGEIIKYLKNFGIFLAFFISFALLLTNASLESMDEIWCFGFSNRLANGYIPYKDFNLVITPFFVVIGSLFSKSLMLFRIYGSLISAGILFATLWICNKNKVNSYFTVLLTLIIGLFLLLIVPYANYNTLLILSLMLSYLSARKYMETPNPQTAFLLGLVLSISILVKQNIPVLIFIGFCIIFAYQLWAKTIKVSVAVLFAVGGLLPILLFVVVARIYGFFDGFINYAVLGLKTFSSLNNTSTASKVIFVICAIITSAIIIGLFKSKSDRNATICTLIFSVSAYATVFPLMDLYHTSLLLIFQTALASSMLAGVPVESINIRLRLASIFLLVIILTSVALSLPAAGKDGYVKSTIDPYRGVYLDSGLDENIKEISEFIVTKENDGYDVAILDGLAYLYNLPANDANGVLDLLNAGNIGTASYEEIISAINEKDIFLVASNYMWQDMIEFSDYVENIYFQAGKVANRTIYLNPKPESISN